MDENTSPSAEGEEREQVSVIRQLFGSEVETLIECRCGWSTTKRLTELLFSLFYQQNTGEWTTYTSNVINESSGGIIYIPSLVPMLFLSIITFFLPLVCSIIIGKKKRPGDEANTYHKHACIS